MKTDKQKAWLRWNLTSKQWEVVETPNYMSDELDSCLRKYPIGNPRGYSEIAKALGSLAARFWS